MVRVFAMFAPRFDLTAHIPQPVTPLITWNRAQSATDDVLLDAVNYNYSCSLMRLPDSCKKQRHGKIGKREYSLSQQLPMAWGFVRRTLDCWLASELEPGNQPLSPLVMPKYLPSSWMAGMRVVIGISFATAVKALCRLQAVRGLNSSTNGSK